MPRVLRPALVLAFALAVCALPAAAQIFEQPQYYLQGNNPNGLVVADLNGDGLTDVASAVDHGPGVHRVTLLLGLAGGGFETVTGPSYPGNSGELTLGDVTGDGNDDLVLLESLPAAIRVLPGDGAGGFGASVTTPLALNGSRILAGRLDADAIADLVVVHFDEVSGPKLTSLIATGSGSFNVVQQMGIQVQPIDAALGDADLDGDLDVVVSGYDAGGEIELLRGNGAGGFTPVAVGTSPDVIGAVALGDITGDGRPDIIGGTTDGVLIVYAGQTGWSGFAAGVETVTGQQHISDIVLADADGDGVLDLVCDGGDLLVFPIGPGGTLGMGQVVPVSITSQIAVATLAGDAWPDLLGLGSVDSLTVVHGDGRGGFLATAAEFPCGKPTASIAAGDLDADGHADLVLANITPPTLTVLRGDGTGAFLPAVTAAATGSSPQDIVVAEFTGDGRLDVLVGTHSRHLLVHAGDGAGGLGPGVGQQLEHNIRVVAAADLDGDGDRDVIAGLGASGPDAGVVVLHNDGAGVLTPVQGVLPGLNLDLGGNLALADLNDDGWLDLQVFTPADVNYTALGDSLGGFGTPTSTALWGEDFSWCGIGSLDLNGDGRRDEITGGADYGVATPPRGLGLRLNAGGGSFGPIAKSSTPEIPTELAAADMNGDGLRDVVSIGPGGFEPGPLSVALSDGAGGFSSLLQFATSRENQGFALADFDEDGRLDVAVSADHFGIPPFATVRVHLNRSQAGVWADLGQALTGRAGDPLLFATGPLTSGSPLVVTLDDVRPNALTVLVVGLTALNAPFKGGVMVPQPTFLFAGLGTGPAGFLKLSATWPHGVPSSAELYLQAWIADLAGPAGFAASNATRGRTP